MKRKNLAIGAFAMVLIGLVPGCDLLEECGTCELVTEFDDGTVTRGTPLPYCGEDLEDKKNAPPVTVGNQTTYWDCY